MHFSSWAICLTRAQFSALDDECPALEKNRENRMKHTHISWHFPPHFLLIFPAALANFPLSFGVGRNDLDNNEKEKTATDSMIMTLINAHTQRTYVHLSRTHPLPSRLENQPATRKMTPSLCTQRKWGLPNLSLSFKFVKRGLQTIEIIAFV